MATLNLFNETNHPLQIDKTIYFRFRWIRISQIKFLFLATDRRTKSTARFYRTFSNTYSSKSNVLITIWIRHSSWNTYIYEYFQTRR